MATPDPASSGLAAEKLCRSFGADQAVIGVNLTVMPGQIHALVGLNGAGKTTLMRLPLGMLHPDAGRASILGRNVSGAAGRSVAAGRPRGRGAVRLPGAHR